MGWLRLLFLGDIGQQLDLSDQRAEIDCLRAQLQSRHAQSLSNEDRLDLLQRENDELKLYVATVLRVLIVKNVATIDEVKALVEMLDRGDGTEDQKYSGEILPRT
jgi:hypothetical protein